MKRSVLQRVHRWTGFTAVDALVATAIVVLLAVAGLPALADALASSRLRAGAEMLRSATLLAHREAMSASAPFVVDVAASAIRVSRLDPATGTRTLVHAAALPDDITTPTLTVRYEAGGRPGARGADLLVAFASRSRPCDDNVRCTVVQLRAAGGADVLVCPAGGC